MLKVGDQIGPFSNLSVVELVNAVSVLLPPTRRRTLKELVVALAVIFAINSVTAALIVEVEPITPLPSAADPDALNGAIIIVCAFELVDNDEQLFVAEYGVSDQSCQLEPRAVQVQSV